MTLKKLILISLYVTCTCLMNAATSGNIIYKADFKTGKNDGWVSSVGGQWQKVATEKVSGASDDYAIFVKSNIRQQYLIRPALNIAVPDIDKTFIKIRILIKSKTPIEYISLSLRQGKTPFQINFTRPAVNKWITYEVPLSSLNNSDFKKFSPTEKITKLQLFSMKNKGAEGSETVTFLLDELKIYSSNKKKVSTADAIEKIISKWQEFSSITNDPGFAAPLLADGQNKAIFEANRNSVIVVSEKNITIGNGLAADLEKVLGGKLNVIKSSKDDGFVLRLMHHNDESQASNINLSGIDSEGFALLIKQNGVTIAAKTARALEYGKNTFLEGIGYRWFMPGHIGACIPEKKDTILLKAVSSMEKPAFEMRFIWYAWGWLKEYVTKADAARYSAWLLRNKAKNKTAYYAYHSFYRIFPEERYFKEHPEYYALINNKRDPHKTHSQICYSNEDVQKITADHIKNKFRSQPTIKGASMTPNDHPSSCRCEACSKLYISGKNVETRTYSYGYPEGADLHINFMNTIRNLISQDYPDKYLCTIVNYGNIVRIPETIKPDSHLVFGFTTMPCCKLHAIDDPTCPVNQQMLKILDSWAAFNNPMYLRDYDPIVYWKGLPAYAPRMIARNIKLLAKKAKKPLGFNTEAHKAWATNIPDFYIRAKLSWNPELDIDKLLDDFYSKFFGPAALDMKNYFEFFQYMLDKSPFHPVARQLDSLIVNLFPRNAQEIMTSYLVEATKKCPKNSVYSERVKMIAMEFDYFKLFLCMLKEMNSSEPDKAYQIINKINALVSRMEKVNRDYVVRKYVLENEIAKYRKRFEDKVKFRKGKHVIPSPTQWFFRLDNENEGVEAGWQNCTQTDDWDLIYSGNSWENQGYDYDGIAWYKASINIPADLKGKKIMLFVGALDESGEFYINGKKVYTREFINPSDWKTSFEFDVSEFLDYGKDNDISVRVSDKSGAGGLWKDIFFYLK